MDQSLISEGTEEARIWTTLICTCIYRFAVTLLQIVKIYLINCKKNTQKSSSPRKMARKGLFEWCQIIKHDDFFYLKYVLGNTTWRLWKSCCKEMEIKSKITFYFINQVKLHLNFDSLQIEKKKRQKSLPSCCNYDTKINFSEIDIVDDNNNHFFKRHNWQANTSAILDSKHIPITRVFDQFKVDFSPTSSSHLWAS